MDQRNRHCTVARIDKTFCDAASLPDTPFPICASHAQQLAGYLVDVLRDNLGDVGTALRILSDAEREAAQVTPPPPPPRRNCVVYYARHQGLIKIGCTLNLANRSQSFPVGTVVVATEPGYYELEGARHRQFAHLREKGEWFRAEPDLLDHIATL